MRKKLFLYYMILVVVGISITGFFISELTQNLYEHEVENKLKNAAKLIDYQIAEKQSKGYPVDFNKEALCYSEALNDSNSNSKTKTNYRVTFIRFDGTVIGESDTDYRKMANHSSRKEIREAIQGKTGKDIRKSKTLRINFLYIAVPLKTSKVIVRVSVPLVLLHQIDRIIWYYTVIGILGGLLLTALLAVIFTSSIISPIRKLISLTKEISKGNYSSRVGITSNDEIGQLAEAFNQTASTLEKTVSDLVDRNIKVDTIMNSIICGIVAVDVNYRIMLINDTAREIFDISHDLNVIGSNLVECVRNSSINSFLHETVSRNIPLVNEVTLWLPEEKILRIYTNPISKSKEQEQANTGGIIFIQDVTNIRKLEQMRTDFVSNVTHELKTPLTSIRGFVETLRSGAIEDREVAARFLDIIDIEAERLYMLINDILQLSEIETGQKDSNIGTYNLYSIAEEVFSILQVTADKKGIHIKNQVDPKLKIVANKDRIKQMLINLVDNGIKYNSKNGSVTVKAVRTEGRIVITVADTGIGIPMEHTNRIFERFYLVDKGRSRSMGGTGLGLSIVKHIINLYNGDVKVNSEPGKGTEFVISLPA
ncbi:MAG TPA: ATP-binding protein [Clostridia bacterium]|nr:ATP-binding protein [Clostridia bacterium]